MAFTILDGGSFLSTGAAVKIPLPSSADYFRTWNVTQLGLTGTVSVGGEWFGPKFGLGQSAANDGLRWRKAGTSAILIDKYSTATASGGFTYVTSFPQPEAAVVGTAITAASPAVVAMVNTYSNGDKVVLYNTVGMEIIGGMSFTVSSVSGTGFTLLGLPAVGFAAAATAVTARRISPVQAVLPEFFYVTAISQAVNAVVTVSQDPTGLIYVGQDLVFQIPQSFGMVQLNSANLAFAGRSYPAKVLSVNAAAYQFTIDIDTTAFTAFAFPASTLSPTTPAFATVAPQGSRTQYDPVLQTFTGYNFNSQPYRSSTFIPYMYLAGGANSPAGAAADQVNWMSYKLES